MTLAIQQSDDPIKQQALQLLMSAWTVSGLLLPEDTPFELWQQTRDCLSLPG